VIVSQQSVIAQAQDVSECWHELLAGLHPELHLLKLALLTMSNVPLPNMPLWPLPAMLLLLLLQFQPMQF